MKQLLSPMAATLEQTYTTSDFYLGTLLLACGLRLSATSILDGRVSFVFDDEAGKAAPLVRQFYAGSLKVNALDHFRAGSLLKSAIQNARDGGGR
jgi:hypothetical protein